ncbi:putative UDP-3-O-[3-hydroxymyristoyl] N-acetylglucosamine deacetylase 1 [Acorus gramineus]|uniref:UDP-3-O-[3-hydroxymyristoyl] N-acetylglucosamine deacetylase 1 n=1 Tax=Acorus gramineus TaxID=55184 RepID=A0AAV9AFL2_ACOGR|nr:putative UDP-3-O-[3-hydroxymyristoyl] N-acetylglucosamine deacetylase 1 [Acorus gramineus]
MTVSRFFSSVSNLKNLPSLSWKPTGRLQRTLSSSTSRSGTGLHSGRSTTAKLYPAMAGEGRYFVTRDGEIPASIEFVEESALCTTVSRDGATVRTVEHLLSALEATGVDNCRIHIDGGDEVPLLDGSARQWVEAIEQVGLRVAKDGNGNTMDKLAPVLHKPVHVWKGDAFIAASPSSRVRVTYEIDFPKV